MPTSLFLYIGHPYDLAFFRRLIPLLRASGDIRVKILLAKTGYFRDFERIEESLQAISERHTILEPGELPRYGYHALRNLFRARRFLKRLAGIADPKDILLSLDKSEFLSNLVLSRFSRAVLFQFPEPPDAGDGYEPDATRTAIANLYNRLTGSKRVSIFHNTGSKGHIYRVRTVDPHYKVIRISDDPTEGNIVLPQVASQNSSPKVLILGSRYSQWKYLDRAEGKRIVCETYASIAGLLPRHAFAYKPHPLEDGTEFREISASVGRPMENVGIRLNAEMYLIENPDIEYVFSIGSTSSKSAYDMGFNSRVFYPLLPLPEQVRTTYDEIFPDMPADFFIRKPVDLTSLKCMKPSTPPRLDPLKETLNELSHL